MFVFVLLCILCVHSSFAIILERKRKLVALLSLSYRSNVTIDVLWIFLTVLWAGLQCLIEVLPDHTHLLFAFNVHSYKQFCWSVKQNSEIAKMNADS